MAAPFHDCPSFAGLDSAPVLTIHGSSILLRQFLVDSVRSICSILFKDSFFHFFILPLPIHPPKFHPSFVFDQSAYSPAIDYPMGLLLHYKITFPSKHVRTKFRQPTTPLSAIPLSFFSLPSHKAIRSFRFLDHLMFLASHMLHGLRCTHRFFIVHKKYSNYASGLPAQ